MYPGSLFRYRYKPVHIVEEKMAKKKGGGKAVKGGAVSAIPAKQTAEEVSCLSLCAVRIDLAVGGNNLSLRVELFAVQTFGCSHPYARALICHAAAAAGGLLRQPPHGVRSTVLMVGRSVWGMLLLLAL